MHTQTPALALNMPEGNPGSAPIPVFARRFGSWHLSLQRQPYDVADLSASYDLAADSWHETIDRLDYLPAYRDLLRASLSRWLNGEPAGHLRVLDCGTGTGAMSEALSNIYAAPLRIDAVDISSVMLAKAGERLRKTGLVVTLRQADAQRLPYADNSFDLVMAGHMLEHLSDPVAALLEMVRVVRPGGLVFACITRRTLAGRWIQLLWRTHVVSPLEAESWMQHAGLQDVHCLSPSREGLFHRLSLACSGIKPDHHRCGRPDHLQFPQPVRRPALRAGPG